MRKPEIATLATFGRFCAQHVLYILSFGRIGPTNAAGLSIGHNPNIHLIAGYE